MGECELCGGLGVILYNPGPNQSGELCSCGGPVATYDDLVEAVSRLDSAGLENFPPLALAWRDLAHDFKRVMWYQSAVRSVNPEPSSSKPRVRERAESDEVER